MNITFNKIAILIILFLIPIYFYPNENNKKIKNKNIKELFKEVKEHEKGLQFGFGVLINSNNFNTTFENIKRLKSIKNGNDYSYPGISDEQEESLMELDQWMQKAVLSFFILRNLEYGIQFRLLWKALIFETDITFTPTDNNNYSIANFTLSPMIGIRSPFFIMPYLIIGPNVTLNVNTDIHKTQNHWLNKIKATTDSIYFSPGITLKTGIDLKFKKFSIGLYYQYKIKDFKDMFYYYSLLSNGEISKNDAGKLVITQQSRIGISIVRYFYKNK